MRLIRLLPVRWQKFLQEVLKFGAVGGINTALNYVVFNILVLTVFTTGQLKATVVATVVATCSSYLMNRYWTYRDRPRSAMRRESALFFFFNGAGLLIELSVLGLVKYGFDITSLLWLNVAKTVGLLFGTVFRFWSYRTFVFKPAKPEPAAAPTPAADTDPFAPLAAELADAVDVALEAELAIELDAGNRRPAAR
jgi:putative flippase GtrA